MGIKLVVFDLGRVLIRICDDWYHAAEMAGLDGVLPDIDPISRGVMIELSTLCEIGAIDHALFCKRIGRLFNIDPQQIEAISRAYLLGPFEGVIELLDELRERGVQIACLSNTNGAHWDMMIDSAGEHAPALMRLNHRFASHLVGIRKPEYGIFKHAEATAGVKPGEVLFFDDMPENVAAAQTHGWEAVVVNDRENPVADIRAGLKEFGVL